MRTMVSPEMIETIARQVATEVVTRIGFRVEVVESLPAEGQNGILYLVAKEDSEEGDVYDEYVWIYSSSSYEHLGTTQVDLSGYTQSAVDEVITGKWTFPQQIKQSYSGTNREYLIRGDGKLVIRYTGSGKGIIVGDGIEPATANDTSGIATNHWKETFTDKITDNNGSYSSDNVLNVLNASDIVDSTLTQAQYDLITNGKPTLIKGLVGTRKDIYIFQNNNPSYDTFLFICNDSGTSKFIGYLTISSLVLSFNDLIQIADNKIYNLNNVNRFNGKNIPAYPSNTGTFVLKCVDGDITWVAE